MKSTTVVLTALEVLNKLYKEDAYTLSISNLVALLTVGSSTETTIANVEKALGLSQAACSRNLTRLGDGRPAGPEGKRRAVKGLKLIESWEDEFDKRSKRVRLTAQGWALIEAMDEAVTKVQAATTKAPVNG